jgi:predicted small lipoprotein YifL
MTLSKTAAIAAKILLIASLLQGCGRKGPLFMQQEPAKPLPAGAVPAEQKTPASITPAQSQPVQTQTESEKQP